MVRKPQKPSGLKGIEPSVELRIAAFETEMLKAHKITFRLEAENASLRAKVKVLEDELKALGKVEPTREQINARMKSLVDNDPELKAYLLG